MYKKDRNRQFGLGLIRTKLEGTSRGSVSLSILTMNVDRLLSRSLGSFFAWIFLQFFEPEDCENHVVGV